MLRFFKKDDSVKVVARVWMTTPAKYAACAAMLKANPNCIFVAWFEDTAAALKNILGNDAPVFIAHEITPAQIRHKLVIMTEHYPLMQKEQEFFKRMQFNNVPVLSALDEPMFMQFGGERTLELMKKLGIEEDEILGHGMISSSIRSVQQKISDSVKNEQKAASKRDWFALNFKKS